MEMAKFKDREYPSFASIIGMLKIWMRSIELLTSRVNLVLIRRGLRKAAEIGKLESFYTRFGWSNGIVFGFRRRKRRFCITSIDSKR
jgi:hypothetical protein